MSYHSTTGRRVLTLFAAATLTLSACSSTDSGTGDTAATGDPAAAAGGEVGFSESFLTDAFQVQLVKQLGEQAKAASVNLLPAANADGDAAKQNADITTLLGRGVKGLIVVPVDSKAVGPAIDRANAKNVPVVTVDLGAESGKIYMVVRADNVYMGKAACEYMGKQINGEGTVLDLQGDLATSNGQDRSKGFTSCMAEQFPNVKVISKPMNWKPEECATQAQTVLSTEKLAGLFMGSESVCLAGVQQALRNQGKLTKAGDPDHIVTVGIDGSKPALDAVREGTLDAVISQPLDLYAKYGIQYIKDAMAGKTYQPGPTDHNSTIVEVGQSLQDLLPSPTVTKENVDDASLWGNG
ncbi:sugar ABC transporter substrate-binding protein [Acrocarpospora catenulata]|uniref:sugar ABC transporter substrate-binding protein n=1 Tax=Acrocarpospora catenulata TaxID=2836182 RepID=UPI001BD99513|nr:sugar ABC transporter substrate-binding protein [Acrocarpospora catenulata]